MSVYRPTRVAAFAIMLGTLALAAPSYAAPADTTSPAGPPNSTVNLDSSGHIVSETPDTSSVGGVLPQDNAGPAGPHHGQHVMAHSPEGMQQHVEERIKTLHAKLGISKDQETQWADVAQAMRDSEANVSSLIQERHKNAGNMNAVDDMDSYQKIAQAHADGLKKVNVAFKKLYDDMSVAQQKNADKIFGTYEGHVGNGHAHHGHKAAGQSK